MPYLLDKCAPMIVIAGSAPFNPEMRDAVIAASTTMRAATRAEPGNLEYRFSFAMDDPNTFMIHEEWIDQASIDEHFATSHMAEFTATLGSALTGAPDFWKFAVTEKVSLF